MDYGVLIVMVVRSAVTFVLLTMIQSGKFGLDENNDTKQLQDLIIFVFMITFSINSVNWRLDLLFTTPLVAVAQFKVSVDAFNIDDGNMDCFNFVAQTFGRHVAKRWLSVILMLLINVYVKTYHELNEFVEHENSSAQQQSF